VGSTDSGFASDTNTVTLFFKDGTTESLPAMDKMEVAHILLDRLVAKELSAAATPKRIKKEQ
jgi:phosphopantothenoylcysteine synthetase/decarboxylase